MLTRRHAPLNFLPRQSIQIATESVRENGRAYQGSKREDSIQPGDGLLVLDP